MLTYHEYEKAVFDWLIDKHQHNPSFTFTVRQSAGKGSETDYFIGTVKSNYFSTSFWTLPVGFPGSSGDCISLILQLTKVGYAYYFEFNQTQAPHDSQNQSALNLVKALKEPLQKIFNFKRSVQEANKMYTIQVASPEKSYPDLDLMFIDIDKQLAKIIEITDLAIEKEKIKNIEFRANRISKDDFDTLINRLNNRIEKHTTALNSILDQFDEEVIDRYFDLLKTLLKDLQIDATSEKVYFNYEKNTLIFGVGQRYVFNVEKGNHFRMISKNEMANGAEEFKAEPKAYLNNYGLNQNIEDHYDELLLGAKEILSITTKSGYYKFDKKDFREKAFNLSAITTSLTLLEKPQNAMSLNQILYGPPGTGKTYHTINKALSIIENKSENDLAQETRQALKERNQTYVANGQIVFTTFHQSMSYEDFVEGIKPLKPDVDDEFVKFDVQNGIFKNLCIDAQAENIFIVNDNFDDAWNSLVELVKGKISNSELLKIGSWEYGLSTKESLKYSSLNSPSQYTFTITKQNIEDTYQGKQARPSGAFKKDMEDIVDFMKVNFQLINHQKRKEVHNKNEKPHILIIDEINRGNVSAIFGELITLIEESKRAGASEALEVILPYSKEKFSVPSNLYIIGTMNTADRSVEALDTALRRRFAFEEMMPEPSKITIDGALKDSAGVLDGVDLAAVLTKINERIAILLDADHQIGHSYLINVSDTNGLANAFNNCIVPLLKEYFYHDDEKIALVLGGGFVRLKQHLDNIQSLFPVMQGLEVHSIDSKRQFELTPITNDTIIDSLQILLNGG